MGRRGELFDYYWVILYPEMDFYPSMTSPTIKTSVSFQKTIWDHLKKSRNRSALINKALELYFDREKFLENADGEYWEKIEACLKGENDLYTPLNPGGTPLTEKLLEEKLWK